MELEKWLCPPHITYFSIKLIRMDKVEKLLRYRNICVMNEIEVDELL